MTDIELSGSYNEPVQCSDTACHEQIVTDILTEMYREAEPPLDFEKVVNGEIDVDEEWYLQHELDSDRQREIVDKHLDKHELTSRQESGITMTCILDYGPATPNEGDNE